MTELLWIRLKCSLLLNSCLLAGDVDIHSILRWILLFHYFNTSLQVSNLTLSSLAVLESDSQSCWRAAFSAFVVTCRYWAFLEARLLVCTGSVSPFRSLSVTMQWSTKNMLSILWLISLCCIYLNLEYASRGKTFLSTTILYWDPGFSKERPVACVGAVGCEIKHWGLQTNSILKEPGRDGSKVALFQCSTPSNAPPLLTAQPSFAFMVDRTSSGFKHHSLRFHCWTLASVLFFVLTFEIFASASKHRARPTHCPVLSVQEQEIWLKTDDN